MIGANIIFLLTEDCGFGDFGDWSTCTKECGGGTQFRSREIIQQAENNGTACGQQGTIENRDCNVHDCAGQWFI